MKKRTALLILLILACVLSACAPKTVPETDAASSAEVPDLPEKGFYSVVDNDGATVGYLKSTGKKLSVWNGDGTTVFTGEKAVWDEEAECFTVDDEEAFTYEAGKRELRLSVPKKSPLGFPKGEYLLEETDEPEADESGALLLQPAGAAPSGELESDNALPVVAAPEAAPEAPSAFDPDFTFETEDIYGSKIDTSSLAMAKLTMINFWEPWCGPCVAEMPELERLYETYKDSGFQILGVYSSLDYESMMWDTINGKGITYPILIYVSEFDRFQTGYVPTTILVDGDGHVLGEAIIGSRDYAAWEETILSYLN